MHEFDHETIEKQELRIKTVIRNKKEKEIEKMRTNLPPKFLIYIESDKNKIIEGLKELKKTNLLFLADPFSRLSPLSDHGFNKEEVNQAIDKYGYAMKQGEISDTIAIYIILTTFKSLEVKELVPELVDFTFSIYKEIYKETGIDLNLLRNMIDATLQNSIRKFYTFLSIEDYKGLSETLFNFMIEERTIINEIVSYTQNNPDSKVTDNPDFEGLNKQLNIISKKVIEERKQIYNFILSSGYQPLLDNYLKELGSSIRTPIDEKNLANLEDIDKLKFYDFHPTSSPGHLIKYLFINNNSRLPTNKNILVNRNINLETGQLLIDYTTRQEAYTLSVDDLKALTSRQNLPVIKTINFILRKSNEQNNPDVIYFDLDEYRIGAGYKNKNSAYKGAIKNFDTLMGIILGGTIKRGKKESRNKSSYIFTGKDITFNQCFIECKPIYIAMLSQYYSLFPKWAGELTAKAYNLLDYIFYMARQKQNTSNISKNDKFNVSFKSINEYIGGPDPKETRKHTEKIIDPLLSAIEEIETMQDRKNSDDNEKLKLTPLYNHQYKNAYEFLDGYLEIQLGKEATEYFKSRNNGRQKQLKNKK